MYKGNGLVRSVICLGLALVVVTALLLGAVGNGRGSQLRPPLAWSTVGMATVHSPLQRVHLLG